MKGCLRGAEANGYIGMHIIRICVGSACHLKGAPELIELFGKAVNDYGLDAEITLQGSFCTGECNRIGVTVQVDGDTFTGVTVEGFDEFFRENVLPRVGGTV